jgi:hypothetical protein
MCRTSGAEAQESSALRGAEAPLFHGCADITVAPAFLALAVAARRRHDSRRDGGATYSALLIQQRNFGDGTILP